MEDIKSLWYSILSSLANYKRAGLLSDEEYEYYKQIKKEEVFAPDFKLPEVEYPDYSKVEGTLTEDEIYDLFDPELYDSKAQQEKILTLTRADLYHVLDAYNWDDGFELPKMLLKNKECDLALAMEIFERGDGFGYVTKKYIDKQECGKYELDWWAFGEQVYAELLAGKYPLDDTPLKLSFAYKIVLAKNGIINFLNEDIVPILKK